MSASRAFVSTFNEKALVASDRFDWDSYDYRLIRYALGDAYYSNTVYSSIERLSTRLKVDRKSYRHIRSIYNPIHRLTELYVAKVYGGGLDFEDMTEGALPLLLMNSALKAPIRQTWLWSNWRAQKSVYVRTGAKLGDVFVWVADEPQRQKVRLEVLHPSKVKTAAFDAVGNVKAATLEYTRQDDKGRDYAYRMDVDGEWYRTYRDGQPFAYVTDAAGNPVTEWPNEYGFVPLVRVQHTDEGMSYGAAAYHGTEAKIDELNDEASILNDGIRKAVNIVWWVPGGKATNLTLGDDGTKDRGEGLRDEVPMIGGPADTTPFAMVPNIDIAAAGENLERMLMELERDMPELSLHRLRGGSTITAPGVRAVYGDAIDRIQEARGNYDDGYIRAQKMAISIGGFRGYDGFAGFNLDSYAAGDIEFYVAERPVISDTLSKTERLTAFSQIGAQPPALQRQMLKELDVKKQDIDTIVGDTQTAQRQQNGTQVGDADLQAARSRLERLGIGDLAQEDTIADETQVSG